MKIDDPDLEMEERTIGLQRKPVAVAHKEELTPVVAPEINSDITELELQERTVGIPMRAVPAAPAVKAKKKAEGASPKKSSGCCIVLLVLGASAFLSIWGIAKII